MRLSLHSIGGSGASFFREEVPASPAPALDAGNNAGKETPASQEVNGSEPGAEKVPAPHQENKDQADGKPLSLFWAEDGDLGWKNGELLYTADEDMRLLENLWGMGLYEKFTEDGEKRRAVFTDPSSFTLYTLLEMLGTMWGTCEYQVDPATGLPAEKQPYFDLLNDNILTARIQVEAAILPEETREWIPAGT